MRMRWNSFDFTYLFYQHIISRQSCGECHFTNLKRPSDITLADYWGWERTDPNFNADDKGCSLVLCNTEKGRLLFEAVQDQMNIIPAKLENVMQGHLSKPSSTHPDRLLFEEYYSKRGLEYSVKKLGLAGWRLHLRNYRRRVIAKLKKFI